METKPENFAIIREIESQIIQLDIKLDNEKTNVTRYVELLSQKRQLQELLNQERNGNR